jgi:hypothetical protein
MIKIHPYVQEFVDAQTRDVVRFEAVGSQVFLANIEVAFKWRNAPSERSVGDHRAAAAKFYAYVAFHTVKRPPEATAYYSESAIGRHHMKITNSSDIPQEV